ARVYLRHSKRGQATYFTPERDACSKDGETSSVSSLIAALSAEDFNGGKGKTEDSPMCGKCLKVYTRLGSVVVKVRDLCATCSKGDVDLTPTAFKRIAPLHLGRVNVKW
ncbi:hypothetical protein K493DRAFT_196272, partial [Basidiobolus meristosporus CBS 931.73]